MFGLCNICIDAEITCHASTSMHELVKSLAIQAVVQNVMKIENWTRIYRFVIFKLLQLPQLNFVYRNIEQSFLTANEFSLLL